LAHAVARDPAMVIYLDTARSRANAPNENFARELLELFTLGVGHYTEDDIKAIARAFTGYSLAPATGEFAFRPAIHDNGSKTVLGQTGMFDGDEIIDILLAHPRTAETVVEQLWRQFISSEPDRGEIVALAATFRTDLAYEIEPLMHALLTSDAFWAQENRAALIKSPVDFLIGTLRQFDTELPRNNQRGNRPGNLLVLFGRELGQDIFDPPNVKGWPGGEAWITSQTLLLRNDIALALTGLGEGVAADLPPELSQGPLARDTLRDMEPDARRQLLMARGMERLGQAMTRSIDRWIVDLSPDWRDAGAMTQLLLARPPADMSADVMEGEVTGALLRRVVTDPVYQLK
ncbi:MAG: DUF1800 family protein, partial [Alphaproteobacteria bacterium]|nr:DUF1800 family protein [Alphaproteobacteria bacterium]